MTEIKESKTLENIKKNINELAYPALILDNEYRILYKNDFCINRLIPLRMGSCIKNHLSSSDSRRIAQLENGEIISISLELNVLSYAYIYCYNTYYVVGIRTLSSMIQNRISDLIEINADLTGALLCQINAIAWEGDGKSITELIKKKSNRIIRAQQHIGEFLRIVNGVKNTKTQVCDLDIILNALMRSLSDTLRPLGLQISFINGSEEVKHKYANICEPDFNTILCLSLYGIISISQSGRIQVNSNVIGEKLYISILTDSILSKEKAKHLCECDLEAENFNPPDGWIYFELLLIKLLSEYYFWSFNISAQGSNYSHIQLSFSIPLVQEKIYTYTTRTYESSENERKGLIALEFSELLDEMKKE